MKKQNKLVAVLSTAALLAIGASMTSFAAGWAEEDGVWVYLDNDNERITDSWRRSGNNWYWLDENGEMATDMLIEDDDDYYYVDANGAMVTNQWVAIENEDAGEDDEPDHYWYYFQANGRAYKRSDSASATALSARTINGKRYAFDTEGRMLYGWVYDGERQTDDDAWQNCEYYLGGEDDGAVSEGWRQISIIDEDMEDAQPGDDYWDEEQDRWFFFQSSGRKIAADEGDHYESRTINGQRYGFDEYGRMIASWYADASVASLSEATQGNADYTEQFMYFSSPEDGARYTRGWFKVVPGYYLDRGEYDDGDDYWYYADGDGNIVASEIRSISGRRYAFDEYGRMIDGLVFMNMVDRNTIEYVIDDDNYDTEDAFKEFANENLPAISADAIRVSYFGDEDDGSMKTGRQTVEIDGENFTFEFKTGSSSRGAGLVGEDDDKLYLAGMLLSADRDDRYTVYRVTSDPETGDVTEILEMDTEDFLEEATDGGVYQEDDEETVYTVNEDAYDDNTVYYLVNTSGTIVENRSSAKDGEDYEFDVDDRVIQSVTLED